MADHDEVQVVQESTLTRLGRQFREGFFGALRWFFQHLLLLVGLVFAPISTVIALLVMLKNGRSDGGYKETFNEFIKRHLYTAIALLILEVGLLHWFFPVTNIIASSILGFLSVPLLWVIFGAAAAALLIACVISHADKTPQAAKEATTGIFERYILRIITSN